MADEARFIAMPLHVVGGRRWTCTRASSTRMGAAYLYRLRFADATLRGGKIVRTRDIIIILLTLVLFGLAIASLIGFHFSISTGTVSWGPG